MAGTQPEGDSLKALYFPPQTTDDEESEAERRRRAIVSRLSVWVQSSHEMLLLKPETVLQDHHAVFLSWLPLESANPPAFEPDDSAKEVLDCLAYVAHEMLLGRCPLPPDPSHVEQRLRSKRLHIRVQICKIDSTDQCFSLFVIRDS